jgi:hypothetical protein
MGQGKDQGGETIPDTIPYPKRIALIPLRGRELLRFDTWEPRGDLEDFLSFGPLYVLDVDGYLGGEPDFDSIRGVADRVDEIWLDVGARRAADAIDCLIAGAKRAFLNTRNLRGVKEIKRAKELSDSIGVTLDIDGVGKVVMGHSSLDPGSLLGPILDMGVEVAIMVHSRFSPRRLALPSAEKAYLYLCGSFMRDDGGVFKGYIEEV